MGGGAARGLSEWGCAKDQEIVMVQESVRRPPHLHTYKHGG
jgi:hypothetical protein